MPKQTKAKPSQMMAGPLGPTMLNNSSSTQARRPVNGGLAPLNAMLPAKTASTAPAATSARTIHLTRFSSFASTIHTFDIALFPGGQVLKILKLVYCSPFVVVTLASLSKRLISGQRGSELRWFYGLRKDLRSQTNPPRTGLL